MLTPFRYIPANATEWARWIKEQDTAIEDRINTGSVTGNIEAANFIRGTGSPEGQVTGNIGDLYTRTDGGTSTTLYVKESGTGTFGWVAK